MAVAQVKLDSDPEIPLNVKILISFVTLYQRQFWRPVLVMIYMLFWLSFLSLKRERLFGFAGTFQTVNGYTTDMMNVRGWIKSVCFEIVIIVMGKFFKEEASLRLK